MINLILTFFSIIFLLLGLASMLTPIPGGIVVVSMSLTVLICSSPTARTCVRHGRENLNWFNKVFLFLEKKVGAKIKIIGVALAKTRPGFSEEDT